MTYEDRINFVEEYIRHWSTFDECSLVENGFKCFDCMAIFIEDGFTFHFGFYDPSGNKIAHYLLNAESGVALMLYDERYGVNSNSEFTGILADILGGLLGTDEFFTLINKPVIICEDAPKPMTMEEIWKDILSSMEKGDQEEY